VISSSVIELSNKGIKPLILLINKSCQTSSNKERREKAVVEASSTNARKAHLDCQELSKKLKADTMMTMGSTFCPTEVSKDP
jgi:hypothetical protein